MAMMPHMTIAARCSIRILWKKNWKNRRVTKSYYHAPTSFL